MRRYNITTPLEAGMVVSNEPGYYEDGAFGIRIENLLVRTQMKSARPALVWQQEAVQQAQAQLLC